MVDKTSEINESINFELITYKDIKILTNFLSEQGKILPRRVTGLTSKQQKKITKLIGFLVSFSTIFFLFNFFK